MRERICLSQPRWEHPEAVLTPGEPRQERGTAVLPPRGKFQKKQDKCDRNFWVC